MTNNTPVNASNVQGKTRLLPCGFCIRNTMQDERGICTRCGKQCAINASEKEIDDYMQNDKPQIVKDIEAKPRNHESAVNASAVEELEEKFFKEFANGGYDTTCLSDVWDFFLPHISLSDSTLREVLGEVGEDMEREGIKVGTGVIKGSEIESGVVIGTNQERQRIREFITKRLEK